MTDNLADAMPFSRLMGVQIDLATAQRVVGRLQVRDDLCTTGGILHGGAAMAFADSLGAIGAFLTLPEGANGTTTVESTTKFLGGAPAGATLIAETEPIKVGRRLSVWQTRIRTEDGRDVALVTQTQMTL
jgi:1,4-dihydroxy-2-naphthoyl-CoA hydrolase